MHNGYYSYELWGHPLARDKSIITCPEHGPFEQQYNNHVNGQGCPECGNIRRSESTSRQWEDPEFRAILLKKWEDPEFRRKVSDAMSKKWEDPEFREKMSQRSRDQWQDPEFREKMANLVPKRIAEVVRVLSDQGYEEDVDFMVDVSPEDEDHRFDVHLMVEDLIIEVPGSEVKKNWALDNGYEYLSIEVPSEIEGILLDYLR